MNNAMPFEQSSTLDISHLGATDTGMRMRRFLTKKVVFCGRGGESRIISGSEAQNPKLSKAIYVYHRELHHSTGVEDLQRSFALQLRQKNTFFLKYGACAAEKASFFIFKSIYFIV